MSHGDINLSFDNEEIEDNSLSIDENNDYHQESDMDNEIQQHEDLQGYFHSSKVKNDGDSRKIQMEDMFNDDANGSSNKKESNTSVGIIENTINEERSIAQTDFTNPQLEQKVPQLLTNVKTMYDLSSDRAKKRLDQMKKRKDILASPDEKGKAIALSIDNDRENLLRNLPIKKFQDEDPNESLPKNSIVDVIQEENMSESLENPLNEKISEAEVVVSDLECNYEEENQDSNSLNTNNKYFIPINNSLRNKRAVSTEKATASYLMALFQDEGENANEGTNNKQKSMNKNNNYDVDDIIEEESENFTENESERKKGSEFFRNSLKSPSKGVSVRSGSFGFYQSDQVKQTLSPRYPLLLSLHKILPINDSPHSQSQRVLSSDELYWTGRSTFKLNPLNQKITRAFHKTSKSDMINIHSVLQKIQVNLQTKLNLKSEEKIKKLQERKSLLVENFFNSKSYEGMPTYPNPVQEGNEIHKFLITQQSLNSTKEKSNSRPREQQDCFYSEEDAVSNEYKTGSHVEENFEEGLPEINNSIMEIKETEEVNFEQELNLQLEKNNIKEMEEVKNINANDHRHDTSSQVNVSHFTVTKPLLEVSSVIKLQIVNEKETKSMFTNNYINNNINNISISIISSSGIEARKKPTRIQHNSITHDIRKKYLQTKGKAQSISISRHIEGLEATGKRSESSTKNSISTNEIKCNKKPSQRTSPKRMMPLQKDLKQYLIYNDNANASTNVRVYSETSVNVPSMPIMSNKNIIFDAIRTLKFPFSSLDHQKFAFDKLEKSKGNFFCLLIHKNSSNKCYNFRGLYEMNIEKNILCKLYATNSYPTIIEFGDINQFFKYDTELRTFQAVTEHKRMCGELHGFYFQFCYKSLRDKLK